jgi:cardiolipin synthase
VNELSYLLLRVRADVTVAVGFVLAVCVTLHVLLRKREVASSVGWIGLAWFAPVTGALSYVMFGVNRVRRRARRMRPRDGRGGRAGADAAPAQSEPFEALRRGIGDLTHHALLPGNHVTVYQDGDEAYPAMLTAIGAAERSIGLSSYIFRDDAWGRRFIEELTAAHGRGVAVRVLIDGIGGGWLRSAAWHRLRRAGVPAARFLHSPLPWRMPFLNLRNHRKILIVDASTAFTGGINIAAQNVQAEHPKDPVCDTHFCIEGPVVGQLCEAFCQDWSFAANEELDSDVWTAELSARGTIPARVIDSGPDEDIEKVEFAVLQAIACARRSIQVMTPYFLPDERLITALALAAQRGVSVDIVIPAKSDHRLVQWATRANAAPLLRHGVRIWQCPPPFRHSKVMVVDGAWSLIGSANWDIRSFRLNFEICVELYDDALAAALAGFVRENFGAALTPADLRARTLPVRLRDAAARLMLPYL